MLYRAKIFKNMSGRNTLFLPFLFLLISCINSTEPDYGYLSVKSEVPEMDILSAEPAVMRKSISPDQEAVEETVSVERKKSFRAGCVLKTADAELALTNIGKIIKRHDGYIDSVNGRTVILKVPSFNLHAAFEEIKGEGETVSEYMEAEDVTEDFYDLDGRIKLFIKSRARLSTLLEYERDIDKKLKILKEIKRIDDELERLKNLLSQLENRIKYSEITVDIVPYNEYEPDRQIPFRWIENLDPHNCSVKEVFRQLKIDLPEDFAVLGNKRYFHGETAGGTLIRIGSVRNIPEGDEDFWQNALLFYLKNHYDSAEKSDSGNVKGVVFFPKGKNSFRYYAGTCIKGPLLYIVEVYYPDEESYESYKDRIDGSLETLRIK